MAQEAESVKHPIPGVNDILEKQGWIKKGLSTLGREAVRKILKEHGYFVYPSGRVVLEVQGSSVQPTNKEVREAVEKALRNKPLKNDIPKNERHEIYKILEEHFTKAIDNYKPTNSR